MKKYILVVLAILLAFIVFFGYSEYKKIVDFKKDVVDYLTYKGFPSEEYSTPKYVKREVMKGLKVETIEISFNSEKNYTYSYVKTVEGIELSATFKKDTGERVYDKKEPIK